jgi:hypothetical protein
VCTSVSVCLCVSVSVCLGACSLHPCPHPPIRIYHTHMHLTVTCTYIRVQGVSPLLRHRAPGVPIREGDTSQGTVRAPCGQEEEGESRVEFCVLCCSCLVLCVYCLVLLVRVCCRSERQFVVICTAPLTVLDWINPLSPSVLCYAVPHRIPSLAPLLFPPLSLSPSPCLTLLLPLSLLLLLTRTHTCRSESICSACTKRRMSC